MQQMDGWLASVDSLWSAAQVHLAAILSADQVLCKLDKFAFVASHILYVGRRHAATVAELLILIERLEEHNTVVKEIIKSPHLTATLLYNVSRRCSTYMIRCVVASSLEDMEETRRTLPFSLEPILLDL